MSRLTALALVLVGWASDAHGQSDVVPCGVLKSRVAALAQHPGLPPAWARPNPDFHELPADREVKWDAFITSNRASALGVAKAQCTNLGSRSKHVEGHYYDQGTQPRNGVAKAGWRPVWRTIIDLEEESGIFLLQSSVVVSMKYPTCVWDFAGAIYSPQQFTGINLVKQVQAGDKYLVQLQCEYDAEVHPISNSGISSPQDPEYFIINLSAQRVL